MTKLYKSVQVGAYRCVTKPGLNNFTVQYPEKIDQTHQLFLFKKELAHVKIVLTKTTGGQIRSQRLTLNNFYIFVICTVHIILSHRLNIFWYAGLSALDTVINGELYCSDLLYPGAYREKGRKKTGARGCESP